MEALAEWTDIKRGVRSGCFMSPDLSNQYSDFIMEGIQVNGRHKIPSIMLTTLCY